MTHACHKHCNTEQEVTVQAEGRKKLINRSYFIANLGIKSHKGSTSEVNASHFQHKNQSLALQSLDLGAAKKEVHHLENAAAGTFYAARITGTSKPSKIQH